MAKIDLHSLQNRPLDDALKIYPHVLSLAAKEYEEIRQGCQQRALALQAFFKDTILGEQTFLRQTFPAHQREQLLKIFDDEGLGLAELKSVWSAQASDQIRFVYGPDLILSAVGNWRVIEDNIGRIGGMTDTWAALRFYLGSLLSDQNDVQQSHRSVDVIAADWRRYGRIFPISDFVVGVDRFIHSLAPKITRGEVAGLCSPLTVYRGDEDRENLRKSEAMKSLGVQVHYFDNLDPLRQQIRTGKIKALVNMDVRSWKPKKELVREIFGERKLAMFEAPGVKVVANKGFLPIVEEMVRYYLHAEPILKTQPTRLIREFDVERDSKSVIKLASESGGRGVILPQEWTTDTTRALEIKVREWLRSGAIVLSQEYLRPSTLPGFNVDNESFGEHLIELRPVTYVFGEAQSYTAELICGRAAPASGDPKNHISRGAQHVVVVPV